jgi:murein DD-endopeptidase MepM/ murein hydrolase activator NlpD
MLFAVLVFGLAACTGVEDPPSTALTRTPEPSPSASPTPTAVPVHYVFPVSGKASYASTHHDYPAADIIAACGLPFVAPADGVILEVTRVDSYDAKVNDGATRGGRSISLIGADGVRYYGAHLEVIEAGINPGVKVTAGQRLATVGKTGNTTVCHLHFGVSPPCARQADWWNRRGVIWPAPYLDAWRRNENRSPAPEIASWQASNGCPTSPQSNP